MSDRLEETFTRTFRNMGMDATEAERASRAGLSRPGHLTQVTEAAPAPMDPAEVTFDRVTERLQGFGLTEAVARTAAARHFDGNAGAAERAWTVPVSEAATAPTVPAGDPLDVAIREVAAAAESAGMTPTAAGQYARKEAAGSERLLGRAATLRLLEKTATVLRREGARRSVGAR